MPSSPNYKRDYLEVPTIIKKDGRAGRRIKKIYNKICPVCNNASLDRIEAGGPYIKENIQLVCTALNSWRADTELEEFKWWCRKVTECQEKEGSPHA